MPFFLRASYCFSFFTFARFVGMRRCVPALRARQTATIEARRRQRVHHAIGLRGAELHDSTEVLEHEPLHRIVLEVRFRPTGTARVELAVDATDDGTVVTMEETPDLRPLSWLPWFVTDPALHARNAWSLPRLRHEVEQRDPPGT
jgi:hypothetical protein